MVHPYLRRRQGIEKTTFPSEELKGNLEKTLGVPLFQEQCMKIAIVAAGFAPSRADELRRAMATFKKAGAIGQFKDEFVNGMLAKGYEREFAERCFSQIQGFGTYGFPESHAASFALLVYCSAWMKCYYPDIFAAAILNSQPMGFYAPAQLVRDAREHGVEIRPADVNASDWDHALEAVTPSPCSSPGELASASSQLNVTAPLNGFGWGEGTPLERVRPFPLSQSHPRADAISLGCELVKASSTGRGVGGEGGSPQKHNHALRLGFRLIAGMRENDGRKIIAARKAGGPFRSPEDLMRRAKLGPAAMLTLARADAFVSLDLTRRETLWHVAGLESNELPLFRPEDATETAEIFHNAEPFLCNNDPGYRQGRFRDDVSGRNDDAIELPPLKQEEAVAEDYAVFGLSLRNHPMAFMRQELRAKAMITAADLKTLQNGKFVKIAGLVLFRQRPGTAKGTIFITMEDETGAANLIVWPKVAETYRRAVFGAKVILCEGTLQKESNVIHVVSRRLTDGTPMLRRLQPEASAFGLRFGRGDEVAHASGGDARASKVNSSWTDTLKSRDFR